MEAQPPHSIVSRTVQPTRLAFPPEELVRVAPQTPHDTTVVEREKMIASPAQSLHETLIKLPAIEFTSSIYKFKLLGSFARCIVGLSSLRASIKNVDSLGWLFTTIRLRTRETTVSTHDLTETSLTPAKFRRSLLLYALNGMKRVLACRRAVSLNLTWHLYHGHHLNSLATIDGYLLLSSRNASEKSRRNRRIATIFISRAP